MIFVTVGTQLPFPRLIDAMDAWAAETGERVVAQAGPDPAERSHLEIRAHLAPDEFDALFVAARAVVGHAGMGTILSARRHRRPLVVLPRRHELGEHRNDHQMATARALQGHRGIHVAWQSGDIPPILADPRLGAAGEEASQCCAALVARLEAFIGQ